MTTIISRNVQNVTVRHDGAHVVMLLNGAQILALPWQAADALASALRAKARDAEEQDAAVAPQIAQDAALLMRSGAPFGLSSDPKILAQSVIAAAHDRNLRRWLPGGIRSRVKFGRPGLIMHEPKKDEMP